jgi:hypothetical protein
MSEWLMRYANELSRGDFIQLVIGLVGVVLTLVVIVLVLYQIHIAKDQARLARNQVALAREQTALGQRQLDIVVRQDAIMNRRANLAMEVTVEAWPSGRIEIFFWAANGGEKSARDFYWYLYVPDLVASYRSVDELTNTVTGRDMRSEGPIELQGVPCAIFRRYHDEPLYPGRRIRLARIALNRGEPGREGFPFFWQMVAEDGVFPGPGDYGRGEVVPPQDSV